MRKFQNFFSTSTQKSVEKTPEKIELKTPKKIAQQEALKRQKELEKALEEQKKLNEQQQQQIAQLQAEKQAHENNIQMLQENYRASYTNSNNNNSNNVSSTALIINGTTDTHKQVILLPIERALISAVKAGNLPVVQVLLGKTLYLRMEDAEQRRKIEANRVKLKLAKGRYEGLQASILALVSDLSGTLKDKREFNTFLEYLTYHFAISDKGIGGNTDEVLLSLTRLSLGRLSQAQYQLLQQAYTKTFEESLRELNVVSLASDILKQAWVVGGRLEQDYKVLSTLPLFIPNETPLKELLACLLQLFSEIKQKKERTYAKLEQAHEALEGSKRKAEEKYQQCANYLINDSNQADEAPLCPGEKGFTLGDLRQWLERSQLPVSFALEDEERLNLLEILAQTPFDEGRLTVIDPPDYPGCIEYLVKAHLVAGELTGIEKVLLPLYQYQENPNTGQITLKTYEVLFETLRAWYKEEPLWALREAASRFEGLALEHDKDYLQGKQSSFQDFLDIFRDRGKHVNEAEVTATMAYLGNQAHADELLAAAIFHTFQGLGRVKRFIHPHEVLYKQSVKYQEDSRNGNESVGFISATRKAEQQKEQAREEERKSHEERKRKADEENARQLAENARQLAEDAKLLGEKDKLLDEDAKLLGEKDKHIEEDAKQLAASAKRIKELEALLKNASSSQPTINTASNTDGSQKHPRLILRH